MKIISYIRGKCTCESDPGDAYQIYLAILAKLSKSDIFSDDPDMDTAIKKTNWSSVYEFCFENFDIWFEGMSDRHEIHIVDIDDNSYLDQYLVTSG